MMTVHLHGARVRGLLISLALVLTPLCALIAAPAALADHTQLSIFQDDQYLLYSSTPVVTRTLTTLKELGVQEIRVTVKWSAIAPDPTSTKAPSGPYWIPYLPTSYPAANWAPYDRVIGIAQRDGIAVDLNITAPGPLWAMGKKPYSTRAADHWYPNATDWFDFVYAVGLRYSGHYYSYPTVSTWSIWNEPDQPGWLSPQSVKTNGKWTAVAPTLYRTYLEDAYLALARTYHTTDTNTILIGELAPEGDDTSGVYSPLTPIPFLRDLYCVSKSFRPLSGTAATALGCPTTSSARAAFAKDYPVLFQSTGLAYHPYYFFHPPNTSDPDKNAAPIDDISRIERTLDRTQRAWGSKRKLPIYYTEYGYQTKPPDPFQDVTPAQQAIYLNEADYMAWKTNRVDSVAQFLLVDSPPDPNYTPSEFGYWDGFQTGLEFLNHKPKPALAAYRLPIWIPHPSFSAGAQVLVWGQIRPESSGATTSAQLQWQSSAGGNWTTVSTVTTAKQNGYFTTNVKLPGTGLVRIAWTPAHGKEQFSRSAPVTRS